MTRWTTRGPAVGAVLALALAAPGTAAAQAERGQWRVMPIFGYTVYDEATPFKNTGVVGGEAHYALTRSVALGVSLTFSRPEVDGSYFPLVLFKVHADTTLLFEAGQQVSQVNYAALLTLGLPLGDRLQAHVQGGLGGYTFFLSRQSMRDMMQLGRDAVITRLLVPVGVGVSYFVGSRIGFRLEVRDEIFTDFDREAFNPVEPRFRNTCELTNFCIPEANGRPPAPKSTNHNFRFLLGFEFVPRL